MVTGAVAIGRADALEEELRRLVAGGLCGDMAAEHLATGGKRFRAKLALGVAAAMGVPEGAALGWAAAVELLHNASLVHDDLQDGDTTRRGHPTVWARHGAAQAINTGDLMLMAPFVAIAGLPASGDVRAALCGCLARRAMDIVRGQAGDLAHSLARPVPFDVVVEIAAGKTAGLFVLPVEGSLLLAGFSEVQARAEAARLAPLGLLYQLQDDLDDVLGGEGADLRQGRLTAPLAAHLERRPDDAAWLVAADPADVPARLEASGALALVRERIAGCAASVRSGGGDPRVEAIALAALAAFQPVR